ncbi:hypothetical protein ACI3PL_32615, partial [Lacticaseibacillus paracasei]
VYLHVRLLDKTRLGQQDSLGKLGVNLIHSCFFNFEQPDLFLNSLFEQLKKNSVVVDAIHFKGPAFKNYNEVLMNLKL